jgi:hypothetical protein
MKKYLDQSKFAIEASQRSLRQSFNHRSSIKSIQQTSFETFGPVIHFVKHLKSSSPMRFGQSYNILVSAAPLDFRYSTKTMFELFTA